MKWYGLWLRPGVDLAVAHAELDVDEQAVTVRSVCGDAALSIGLTTIDAIEMDGETLVVQWVDREEVLNEIILRSADPSSVEQVESLVQLKTTLGDLYAEADRVFLHAQGAAGSLPSGEQSLHTDTLTLDQLEHAEILKCLVAAAAEAEQRSDPLSALSSWKKALEFLPTTTKQHESIAARIRQIEADLPPMDREPHTQRQPPAGGTATWRAVGLSTAGAFVAFVLVVAIWQFEFVASVALVRTQQLISSFTDLKRLFSSLLAIETYWRTFGWAFVLPFLFLGYVHELGHVFTMWRRRQNWSFIALVPVVGVFRRIKQRPTGAEIDGRMALSGPVWGAVATALCWAAAHTFVWPSCRAAAHASALLNLFFMTPVWRFDGARAFAALSRRHRISAMVAIAIAWWLSSDSILALPFFPALVACFRRATPAGRDRSVLLQYVALVGLLTWLAVTAKEMVF